MPGGTAKAAPIERITVGNYVRWGKLVKTWATGRTYFDDNTPPIPIERLPVPRTVQELKDQAKLVGAELHIPDNVCSLTVVQNDADSFLLRLPPRDRLLHVEDELSNQPAGRYDFPTFYRDFIDRDLSPREKLDAQACRVGDYTINICG